MLKSEFTMAIYIRKVTKSKWDWKNPVSHTVNASTLGKVRISGEILLG